MDVQLNNKVAVITGGSTGIGAATAIEYAKAGAKVVFGDINEADAEKTLRTIIDNGGTAKFQRTDVTVETEVADLMETADTAFGGIDTLVTSAGVLRGPSVRIDDFEAATFDSVIDVNLKGTFFALKHAVPIMGRENGGVILCIASGAGVRGGSSSVAYASSKGGVNGLVMTVENQVGGMGIRMHTICPGGLATPLKLGQIAESAKRDGQDADAAVANARNSLGDPAGVARVLTFLASDAGSYTRGQIFTR
ncbi:MAG: SDR family NAD(P)-dependent oxidoreductase [Candidatus Poribacteria bacterium]|nr:SDR family NAD(P)-dependent oxidoreductase [Candidatus Poribacteria bacterium]